LQPKFIYYHQKKIIMFNRIKDLLVAPKTAWAEIEGENKPHLKLFMEYVLPLSLIPAISSFIGYGFIGKPERQLDWGLYGYHGGARWSWHFGTLESGILHAVTLFVAIGVGIYITAFIINILATNFGAKKDFNKAFTLVAYSFTPACLAGALYTFPILAFLAGLAGLYGGFLLFLGIMPIMQVPEEKRISYFVVSLVAAFAVLFTTILILMATFWVFALILGGFGLYGHGHGLSY
jgi:hypothetical protein